MPHSTPNVATPLEVWVSIVDSKGSVPREVGAMMRVTADKTIGTIGGGTLEWRAVQWARELFSPSTAKRRLSARPITRKVTLGANLGQCCGGAVTLRFLLIPNEQVCKQRLTEHEQLLLAKRLPVKIFGAGHLGRALVRALAPLPCRVIWIDSRENPFPSLVDIGGGDVELVACDEPQAEVKLSESGTAFVVMTHDHSIDLAICEAIYAFADYSYFGLVGSGSKRKRFENVLRKKHRASFDSLAQLRCPIGVPGIRLKEPAVIAASVATELMQVHSSRQIQEPWLAGT